MVRSCRSSPGAEVAKRAVLVVAARVFAFWAAVWAVGLEVATLRLEGVHQAQFAGFYVAEGQGFCGENPLAGPIDVDGAQTLIPPRSDRWRRVNGDRTGTAAKAVGGEVR